MSHNFDKMTVVELKDLLKEKNLPTIGKKAELVERLTIAAEEELLGIAPTGSEGANSSVDDEAKDSSTKRKDEESLAHETNGNGDTAVSTAEATSEAEAGSSKTENVATPTADSKAKLARLRLPISAPAANKNAHKFAERAKRFGLITALDIDDAKAARAKRFGIENVSSKQSTRAAKRPIIDEDAKKKLINRAARFGIEVNAEGKRRAPDAVASDKPTVDIEKLAARAARFGVSTGSVEMELKKKARLERFGSAA